MSRFKVESAVVWIMVAYLHDRRVGHDRNRLCLMRGGIERWDTVSSSCVDDRWRSDVHLNKRPPHRRITVLSFSVYNFVIRHAANAWSLSTGLPES